MHDRKKAPYDVVALVASAGGHGAIMTVLRALPETFPVPIVVMQHLPPDHGEALPAHVRSLPFAVEWARRGTLLAPGRVCVAPPRTFVELLPDGSCALSECLRGALDKPIDRLLQSIARSFANRAVAVVLSGMMDDGAQGARELRDAGGSVIAQSDAEYGEMPQAALRSGGADVSVASDQIGRLLIELAGGGAIPRPRSELEAVQALFGGDGVARATMRAVSWSATSLGPVREWSEALRSVVRNQLSSSFASCIYWGPELVQIYNDAFVPLFGAKPTPAGRPARLTWPELWSSMGPRLESVLQTGKAVHAEDQLFDVDWQGAPEERYLTYSNTPLWDAEGSAWGVLATATDTTQRVRATRRLEVLRDLAALENAASAPVVAEAAAKVLANAPLDIPFALLYLLDARHTRANLAAAVGVDRGTAAAPHTLLITEERAVWPLGDVARTGVAVTVDDLRSRLAGLHLGPWPESPSSALLLPLRRGVDGVVAGVIVLGASPRLRSDATYREFLELVAHHISTALGEADARQRERERSERYAELDRAKVDFFSNVSHEFRTPLTLLLGPLDEILARRDALPPDLEGAIEAAARNGRRLLRLVNNLLDFSQSESRHVDVRFEATDLAALTTDVASAFRSAIVNAGLRFDVTCDAGLPPVQVDREMWEKIVSNLLANALKFTLQGGISVALRRLSFHVELRIQDTGIGIPERELPNLFKRFHRVRDTRARTAEGSGIGLWMVDDLLKRMGGQVRVHSIEDAGTTFTIWLPLNSTRAARQTSGLAPAFRPTEFAAEMAHEISRWSAAASSDHPSGVLDSDRPVRVLVADDNADMRDYLHRLLSPHWRVDTAADGTRAFELALELRPDVILADVMMPGLDGFELLKRVRVDPELRHTPVVLVTARAGEEAAVVGLMAGANDYLAKPFSPRELVARIAAVVDRTRAEAALRASEAELTIRNVELERFNKVTVGRELQMIDLKHQLDELREQYGEAPPDERRPDPDTADAEGRNARRATLNVLEDAVAARDLAHRLNRELREREAWLRGQREALGAAVNGAPLAASLDILVRTAVEALGGGTRAAFYLADEAQGGDVRLERGCWRFPIHTAAGTFVGTLAIYSREPREATERDRELAALLTQSAAIIIAQQTESLRRERAERALRDSEARFRAFVRADAGVMYRMNADWSEMRELDGQGFLSDTPEPTQAWMDRYIPIEDQPTVAAAIQRAVTTKCPFELDHRVRRADGGLGWAYSRAIPILDAAGEIVEWVGGAFAHRPASG